MRKQIKHKKNIFDLKLGTILGILLSLGLLILYSASDVTSFRKFGSNGHYFFHQLLYGALPGLILMYIFSKIDYHKWQKFAPLLIFIAVALLMAVFFPHLGFKVGNAKRWISTGPLFFQPSELAKLFLIFYLAAWLDKRRDHISNLYYGVIPALFVILVIAGLVFLEPDVGTALIIAIISLAMLFVGGSRLKHLGLVLVVGMLILLVAVKVQPYRMARFTTFLNPSADPQGIGYQINQARLAIGSGGLFGYGYGHSRQKYNYLPEVMGDSIFAVTVEELGFVLATAIIALYIIFAFRASKIANAAPDMFGKMVAVGIISWICFQALINIGAIIGAMPLTGVPLPFISYGSSSLIITLAAMGVLLNISKANSV